MYEAATALAGEETAVEYFPDRDSLLDSLKNHLREYLPEGCTVLLKASHGMEFGRLLESIPLLIENNVH